MFRPYKVILRSYKKTDPTVVYVKYNIELSSVETCRPDKIYYFLYKVLCYRFVYKQLLDLSSWRA